MSKKLENMDQGQRINYMLDHLGISAAQFSREVGCKEVSVSQWRRNLRTMNMASAEKIHDRFPQFSMAFILGASPYQNENDKFIDEFSSQYLRSSVKAQGNTLALIALLDAMGYTVIYPHQNAETVDEVVSYWLADMPINTLDKDGNPINNDYCIEISKNGETIKLNTEQFKAIADEMEDFASVRLNRLFACPKNTL